MLDFSKLPDVSEAHPELSSDELWYAAHMKAREDAFDAIFGHPFPDGKIRTPVDPALSLNWAGGGFYQYPPRKSLSAWHYVSHGMAQPGEESELGGEYSGWGAEYVFSTPQQAEWPFGVLLNLVKYMLFQENSRMLLPGDRIPCNGPIDFETPETQITHIIVALSPDYENEILLPAGRCDLIHLIGVTGPEHEFAHSYGRGTGGTLILIEVLEALGVGYETDVNRRCLTEHQEFEATWERHRRQLEEQWASQGGN